LFGAINIGMAHKLPARDRIAPEHPVSITTLTFLGGPYDGRTIDVNDRVLVGDAPIHVVVPVDGASTGSRKIGEYRVRALDGRHVLAWVEEPRV
jgi:hypothetical protein